MDWDWRGLDFGNGPKLRHGTDFIHETLASDANELAKFDHM
jgi:hypothetical protein